MKTQLRFALAMAVLLGPVCVLHGQTQQSVPGMGPTGSRSPLGQSQLGQMPDDSSPYSNDPIMQEKRLKALNAERQKSLVADTNRLVKLAAELNAEVNGQHPHDLSANQLRKVAEIEKLAHSVRDKMCMSVRETAPSIMPTQQQIIPPGLR